jgi:hypothetical protein
MINPMRRTDLLRTILETLQFAQGYAVLEGVLRAQVDGLMRPRTEDSEWKDAIDALKAPAAGAIVTIDALLDPTLVQWAITERGRVLLKTL